MLEMAHDRPWAMTHLTFHVHPSLLAPRPRDATSPKPSPPPHPETPSAHPPTLVMFLHPIRVRQTASASRPAASSLARRP